MLMNYLSIIVRYGRVYSMRELQKYDIGSAEQFVLMYLAKNERVNQESIARHFLIDKGTIAKTLGKLETKQLIERYTNPENQREKLILLAAKGKAIMNEMQSALAEWNRCIFEGLSDEEIAQHERITAVIAENAAKTLSKEWGDFVEETR